MRLIAESNIDDIFLTNDEAQLINDTRVQKQKGELLNMEDVFGVKHLAWKFTQMGEALNFEWGRII